MIIKNISGCCSLLCSDDSGYQWHHQFKCQFQCLAPDKWTTRTFPGALKWIFLNHNIYFYEALSPIPLAIFGFSDKLFCAALLTSLGQNQDPLPLLPPLHRQQHLHHLQQHLLMDSQVVRVLGRLQLRPHISSSKHLLKWSVHREKVAAEYDVLIVWKENIFCCITEDQSSRQWSVCWNCLENVSPPSSSSQSVPR